LVELLVVAMSIRHRRIAKSRKQRAESREQRAESREQRTKKQKAQAREGLKVFSVFFGLCSLLSAFCSSDFAILLRSGNGKAQVRADFC